MKKLILMLFLILIPIVLAEETLRHGDTRTVGGKEFKLIAVGETENVVVSVDGVKNIVNLNQEKEINGINILLTNAIYMGEDSIATFILESVEEKIAASKPKVVVCGDGVCEENEDNDNCCKDCGCKYGYGCEDDKCVKAECLEDSECYATPKDYCSLDKCDAITKKCTHNPITSCVVNDKCCPTNCYYPRDPDCPTTKINPNPEEETLEEIEEKTMEGNETSKVKEIEKESFIKKIIDWIRNLFS